MKYNGVVYFWQAGKPALPRNGTRRAGFPACLIYMAYTHEEINEMRGDYVFARATYSIF